MSISATLHDVQLITVSKPANLGIIVDRISYCRVLKVQTESGEVLELALFSPDPNALSLLEEY